MSECYICPRKCGADRSKKAGFCTARTLKAAKICLHHGEEPCISGTYGSAAIFFSGCPLKCVFCQNTPISRDGFGKEITVRQLADIFLEYQQRGAHNINLVTPTHFSLDIARALETVKHKLTIPVVYNCGGYELVETLKMLDGLIDVYLPDFKYADSEMARLYSAAADYPKTAQLAIEEMYRQRGAAVFAVDRDCEIMKSGVLVRHMVLPGGRHDSMRVLDILAQSLPVKDIRLSLLRQYTPCYKAALIKPLDRRVTTFEYNSVVNYADSLGFIGYTQEKSSATLEMTPTWDLEGL